MLSPLCLSKWNAAHRLRRKADIGSVRLLDFPNCQQVQVLRNLFLAKPGGNFVFIMLLPIRDDARGSLLAKEKWSAQTVVPKPSTPSCPFKKPENSLDQAATTPSPFELSILHPRSSVLSNTTETFLIAPALEVIFSTHTSLHSPCFPKTVPYSEHTNY